MSKAIRITTVDFLTFTSLEFKPPTSYYVRNASGEYLFFHTRDRHLAQMEVDSLFGKGHYKINASRIK